MLLNIPVKIRIRAAVTMVLVMLLASCASRQSTGSSTPSSPPSPSSSDKIEYHRQPDLPSIDDFNQNRAYVPSIPEGIISAINLENNTVAWTANNVGTVTILDAKSLDVLKTIQLREFANDLTFAHVAFSYDGARAYVSFASDIAVIDVMTRKLLARLDIGTAPHEISLEDYYVRVPEGSRITPEHNAASISAEVQGTDTAQQKEVSRSAGITIEATLKSKSDLGRQLSFAVAINTHSGDLMGIDLVKQTKVRVSGAPAEASLTWTGEGESNHHRRGTIEVSFLRAPQGPVTLVFQDIGIEKRDLLFDSEEILMAEEE